MPTKPRKHKINQMGILAKNGSPDEEIQTLRLAVEQSFHGINIADLEGIIIYANPASEAMYGYRKGQLAGKHVGIFNAEPKMSKTQIIPAIKSNGSWSGELIQKRKDGSQFMAHLSASIVVKNNEPIGMLGIVKDITERKLAEEALRSSRMRLERSQQVAHLGSWEFEIANQKLIWSDEVFRIFGYQPQEFNPTYETFLEHVHPEDRARVDAVYKRSLHENLDSYEMEHRILRQPSGEIRIVHEKCDHLRDADGGIVRSLGIIHDISERKQAEQALKRLNESLEEQVAERTALAEARTKQLQALSVELIEAEERERQRISHLLHEDLQQVLAAAKFHLQEICENLPHSTELTDVVQMLSESIAISRSLSQELSPAILHQTDLAKSLEWLSLRMGEQFGLDVRIDAEAVHPLENSSLQMFVFRAVQELLFNVVKHAGVKSARVALSYTDDGIIIGVSDEGRGFNPDILNSSPEKAGLGLLSLRERASYIGGSFRIESALGRGSRLTLLLPLGFSTKESLPENIEPQPNKDFEVIKNGKAVETRVLFADDHQLIRQGLIKLISGQPKIRIEGEAGNGREALELALRFRPDVIVMDIYMPEMDGIEATRHIKKDLPGMRVIGLSISEDEELKRDMRKAGAEVVVSKSSSKIELLKAIYGIAPEIMDHPPTTSRSSSL